MHGGEISAHLDFSDFGGRLSPFPYLLIYEQNKNGVVVKIKPMG